MPTQFRGKSYVIGEGFRAKGMPTSLRGTTSAKPPCGNNENEITETLKRLISLKTFQCPQCLSDSRDGLFSRETPMPLWGTTNDENTLVGAVGANDCHSRESGNPTAALDARACPRGSPLSWGQARGCAGMTGLVPIMTNSPTTSCRGSPLQMVLFSEETPMPLWGTTSAKPPLWGERKYRLLGRVSDPPPTETVFSRERQPHLDAAEGLQIAHVLHAGPMGVVDGQVLRTGVLGRMVGV